MMKKKMCLWFIKLTLLCMLLIPADSQQQLKMGFYRTTCPAAERIVRDTVNKAVTANPGMAAGIIRLFFHDCFVRGCDASLLLKTVPNSEVESEQDAGANAGTLRGLEVIDEAKAKLEAACPKTVSCADILAFAARDSTTIVGGFSYAIPSGRRDGRVSNIADVDLPSPDFDLLTLKRAFVAKGLSVGDMVALSGAHSIGRAGCNLVAPRLYFFNGEHTDPSLDPKFAAVLKKKCPKNQNSDEALLDSPATARTVDRYANNSSAWRNDFAAAMVCLGSIGVLTGTKGEIRHKCGVRN